MKVSSVALWLELAASAAAYLDSNGQVIIPGASSYNGLNLLPQMGWNNWIAYACALNEELVLNTAQAMVNYGLRDLGYNYVSLDDCWSEGRDSSGNLIANSNTFPHGMKYIADKLHGMGLKFGMYSSAGVFTCARFPGSLGYEDQDAQFFADNEVDYLKYDNCFNEGQSGTPKLSFDRYDVMSKALNKTGRPIVYSIVNWGNDDPYDWAYSISNSARMSGDIYDSFKRPDARCPCTESWGCKWPGFHCSVMNILNKMATISYRTLSGFFNDMDGLVIGNSGQTDSEYVVQMSMWAMMSSPLMISTNIMNLSAANLAIYSNPAVLALNQDLSASAGVRKWRYETNTGETALWTRRLHNGDVVIALINAQDGDATLQATLSDIFLDESTTLTYHPAPQLSQSWDVYDLWANRMSNDEASSVLKGTAPPITATSKSVTRYNATALSYAAGVNASHPALFGKKVGNIRPNGQWSARIKANSVGLYRLRPAAAGSYGGGPHGGGNGR